MEFVSNGTSSPVSGPFPAKAFKASNTRGDLPPHMRDAPHRAGAAPASIGARKAWPKAMQGRGR